MKHLGIHTRLLIAAFVLIGAATLSLGAVGVHMTGRFMHERFEGRIAFLARYLALKSEVGVLISDRSGLKSLAHNLLGEKDVARVQIIDKEGTVLVDLSRQAPDPLSMVETPVVFKRVRDENILFSDRAILKPNPFMPNPPKVEDYIGTVRIHFSTYSIDQLIVVIAKRFIWLSAALALVAGLVFYLVSRPIGAELNTLADTARRIGGGALDLRVNPGRLPETRALAFSFNAMLDSLKESQRDLDTANQEMMKQKALAEMGKFSMMVAHEVKNPLAIIKSSLDVMKKDVRGAGAQTMVGYIEDEIVRLNRLIEDFLQFARPAKPTLREVDLNHMLGDVANRFEMITCDSGPLISFQGAGGPCLVQADRDLLMRAFGNIIKNACDAVDTGGRIDISAGPRTEDGKALFWCARIRDNGVGIDPSDLEKIFEPFFTTRAKGSGLGLAFAAQAIGAHGGTIKAGNNGGGGAVFTVSIPLGDDPRTAGSGPSRGRSVTDAPPIAPGRKTGEPDQPAASPPGDEKDTADRINSYGPHTCC